MEKKVQTKSELLATLPKNLFWDVDFSTLKVNKHKQFIIERVLSRAFGVQEVHTLFKIYGNKAIADATMNAKYLDKYTVNFCANYFKIPITDFRCFILKQSNPAHFDY